MEQLISGPFQPIISFKSLKLKFEELLVSGNAMDKLQAKEVLSILEKNTELVSGISSLEGFKSYKKEVEEIMSFLFPSALGSNEIKAALFPYSNQYFYLSKRLKSIIESTTSDVNSVLRKLYKDNEDSIDLNPYAIILNQYYGFNVDFDRPKQIRLNDANGKPRTYRVTFNADFIDIYPNGNAVEITPEILDELLEHAQDESVWRRYFPDNSWTIDGFGILSMIDITLDGKIDEFKTHLIQASAKNTNMILQDVRNIFNIEDLEVGNYIVDGDSLIRPFGEDMGALTLRKGDSISCKSYACKYVYNQLFEKHLPVVLSNVPNYAKHSHGDVLSEMLLEKGFKSAILLPIVIEGKLQFIVEMAAYKVNQLNDINKVKLDTIMPFILSHSKRSIAEYENEIKAVIQNQCTSIHPAVEWRFIEEAHRFIQDRNDGKSANFNEITFEDVLPLYGQIDIVGSSVARNRAIQEDLQMALNQTKTILQELLLEKSMPFYEQLIYKIDKQIYELDVDFNNNTEQEIHLFFERDIYPLFRHLKASASDHNTINKFLEALGEEKQSFYVARKQYDQTINIINKNLSVFLDKQQLKAQAIFPHFFEKFKTDGIEHNMYVGQSIVENGEYHESDIYNLRLWQLQVMCEMESLYYKSQESFPVKLDVASLILVYDVPLTIRYRIDEKQFDVDGAYNVRYEMIKKRIDKAVIKGTTERITQPHKLCVVFSTNSIEREYLSYFEFLQSKNYIGDHIEIVEVEELQGASGIKAIRADINPNLMLNEKVFSIEDIEATL
ncbi:conserved hypothetical protein [Formosa agariphila KMM 3901]|uniref:GAF domain-containing protein n=1 Tax=Formosa agariphila (strain DSM 15362 / KCTC 12365 / LMG 23005 / KMM 3901 / M-2Alg 35-1) TaxID=1347342 RepID=T2KN33_FORAG|nr:hypothetical protein [Formosa agariphila]CDF80165.1 conserved hypothetical protein [Formosa agariphila KMM 3901]